MKHSDKSKEDRIRGRLKLDRFRLVKMPARSRYRELYLVGYHIIEESRNLVAAGYHGRPFDLSLDEVEAWANGALYA
jgi:hypothetical protein